MAMLHSCPRCSQKLPSTAFFCRRCGVAVALIKPRPVVPPTAKKASTLSIVSLFCGGVILAGLFLWRVSNIPSPQPSPTPITTTYTYPYTAAYTPAYTPPYTPAVQQPQVFAQPQVFTPPQMFVPSQRFTRQHMFNHFSEPALDPGTTMMEPMVLDPSSVTPVDPSDRQDDRATHSPSHR
jgi:hypothetical protein